MNKKTWKIIGDIGLTIIILGAIASMLFMRNEIKELESKNEQLLQENTELQIEYFNVRMERDELLDAVWNENNRKMKEGEEE